MTRNNCNHISLEKKPTRFSEIFNFLLVLIISIPLLNSCNTTQYLNPDEGETLLVTNSIRFDKSTNKKVRKKSNLTENLSARLLQKPNGKFFGIPRPYFYYVSQDTFDKSKFGKAWDNMLRNVLGEEPIFLDSIKAVNSADRMTTYLQNKGYFLANVTHKVSTNKKRTKATVTYNVQTKGQYLIDTIRFESIDSNIQQILNEISDKSFLQIGKPIDIELYEKEVSRITNHLINRGYANFYPQYISNIEATDSSNIELSAELVLEILVPSGKESHTVYEIGNIYVYPNFRPTDQNLPEPDTIYNGIYFASGGFPYKVKLKSIANSIAFQTGDLFSFDNVEASRMQIGALGVFTTPTIKIEEDSIRNNVLNFYIQLTSNKKWEIEMSGDVSYTNRTGPGFNSNLIGLTASPGIRNRNMFRGAELWSAGLDLGFELAPLTPDTLINLLDISAQTDLYFPRLVEFPKIWKGLRNLGLIGGPFYDKLKKTGISHVSLSYNWLKLINNYSLNFVNLSFGHDVKLSATKSLRANQSGIDLLIPVIVPNSDFDSLLNEQPFLERSFSKQFITGFLFRDLTYTYDESFLGRKSYWFFRGNVEVSGLEIMSLNALYNAVSGSSSTWSISDVDFSHFVKLDLDGRKYWRFGPNRTLVARLNTGIVLPFYNSSDVPYVKQFFVGGPNSIRGWYARGLGPGLYRDPLTENTQNRSRFYQAAGFKIEFNLEYRFFLMRPFGLFNLYFATFVDGGNIWTLKSDPSRIGSKFSLKKKMTEGEIIEVDNFINEMAISSGIGFRFDVSYFTLRVDLGTPIRNNFPDPNNNNSYWVDFKGKGLQGIVLNLGLGYPF